MGEPHSTRVGQGSSPACWGPRPPSGSGWVQPTSCCTGGGGRGAAFSNEMTACSLCTEISCRVQRRTLSPAHSWEGPGLRLNSESWSRPSPSAGSRLSLNPSFRQSLTQVSDGTLLLVSDWPQRLQTHLPPRFLGLQHSLLGASLVNGAAPPALSSGTDVGSVPSSHALSRVPSQPPSPPQSSCFQAALLQAQLV